MQLCTKNFYSRPLQKCFTTPLGLNPQVENNWLRPNQRILQPSATILKNLPISTDDLFEPKRITRSSSSGHRHAPPETPMRGA